MTLHVMGVKKDIRSEGPFTGTPAIIVTLAGCSVGCSWCDTEYSVFNSNGYKVQHLLDLINSIKDESKIPLIVITGGEPLEQEVGPLVNILLQDGYRVELETSGVAKPDEALERLLIEDSPRLHLCLSPKDQRYQSILYEKAKSFRYIVGADVEINEDNGIPLGMIAPRKGAPVYLQPLRLDDGDHDFRAVDRCEGLAIRHGYKVSYRMAYPESFLIEEN